MITKDTLRMRLRIPHERLDTINGLLLDPNSRVINDLLDVVAQYGTPEEINRQANEARRLDYLMLRLAEHNCRYLDDLEWLIRQRDAGAFIPVADYRRKVLGPRAAEMAFRDDFAVTLEISAAQYFPWLIEEAKQAIANGELMPGRFIRVRKMRESEADCGDLLAFAAAMQIMGASYVETLDTKGTDGSNIHLGGPATITGYFGGIGQPNDHVLKWVDEFLYYYTRYGVRQVLNLNPGTVLAGYLLHKLGIDIEFKISVFMGNDNPYATLWTLLAARLFARDDGTCPLIGFNLSNSVNNETIEITAEVRRALGFEEIVRIEHHITEAYKGVVIQPYNRRDELLAIAGRVPNISAKHEGADPEIEATRDHPSDVFDYFRAKEEIEAAGDMPALLRNYLDKHEALNRTARALTEHGLSFVAARELHHRR
ncbi:MAG: hypothetical protein ACP5UQ_09925 [Anaerolineae bacterium]